MQELTKEWIAQISERAAKLNELSDAINEEIEEIEDALATAGVGLFVEAPTTAGSCIFGYGKVDQKWCLTVRYGATEERRPLLKAPRADRIIGLEQVNTVLFQITLKQDEFIARLSKK